MGTAIRPASTTPASWDAFSDADAFVEEHLLAFVQIAFVSILSRRLRRIDTQAASA
ncbi:hypothetical protein SAMN02982917_6823 [Azospirillum oryzae]|uniref:Uncharacterized protein n=1 Tax=Azospirillum oryzae TaxID=286727 RepID=A0A1X7HN14_9PROT|nr:hypothetical protein [Azospirillum oryzae]SMF89671.1 hypothetical protein SAMN02982917_6823 [Azospirillum oryzae]